MFRWYSSHRTSSIEVNSVSSLLQYWLIRLTPIRLQTFNNWLKIRRVIMLCLWNSLNLWKTQLLSPAESLILTMSSQSLFDWLRTWVLLCSATRLSLTICFFQTRLCFATIFMSTPEREVFSNQVSDRQKLWKLLGFFGINAVGDHFYEGCSWDSERVLFCCN